jgi:hypothetical protein
MMKLLRACWAPIGLSLRALAWLTFAPFGLWLSWRKGRNKRHRQLVHAIQQPRYR